MMQGTRYDIRWTAVNSGSLLVGPVHAAYYLSVDTDIDPEEDIAIGGEGGTSLYLPAGSSLVRDDVVDIPASVTSASYYVGVIIDHLDEFNESDESNNTARTVAKVAIGSSAPGGICGTQLNFTGGAIPAGYGLKLMRGGPGPVAGTGRLEGWPVDGGAEVGRLESAGLGASTVTIRYRGNLEPIYWGMWDGISLPMMDGTTWTLESSTKGYGAGVAPPNRLLVSRFNGVGSILGLLNATLGTRTYHRDDAVIPSQGAYRYEVILTAGQVRRVLTRDSDNAPVADYVQAMPGFDPSGIRGFAIHVYTTSGPPTNAKHWIDDVQVTCSN
jgi:hypothetical protein